MMIDPRAAGRAIYERIPNDERPHWAVSILSACCNLVPSVPAPVKRVVEIAADPDQWKRGHEAFSDVRNLTLIAESVPTFLAADRPLDFFELSLHPPRNQSRPADSRLQHILLYVAENAAKVIYNATGPSDPFDEESGEWLVQCAYDFAMATGSADFCDALWLIVSAGSHST